MDLCYYSFLLNLITTRGDVLASKTAACSGSNQKVGL